MTTQHPILAKQYLFPRDTAVESASRLAALVIQSLQISDVVAVDFNGMRGVSSSYFNTLFRTIGESVGIDRMSNKLKLVYESDAQKVIGDRSWEAVVNLLSE